MILYQSIVGKLYPIISEGKVTRPKIVTAVDNLMRGDYNNKHVTIKEEKRNGTDF